jgi:UDP-N-acetylglucosamine 2-epimerase (non-hydrolysing)
MGAIAAAQLNIPIVHIEGCMRSYDWRMPEEKYRTIVDHLSDVIYAYFDDYKAQGVREGLNPDSIVVVGNPIVDILQHYYFDRRDRFDQMADAAFFADRGLTRGEYYVMTCHRRENVESPEVLRTIVEFLGASPRPVYLPASYRTQRRLADFGLTMPPQVTVVDPVGYEELLCLMVNSAGALTDSGTIVEEACVLNVPSVQMRKATERPQVYDARSSVKFDPADPARYPFAEVFRKLESLRGTTWDHNLGDGQTSARIAADLCQRMVSDGFRRHRPSDYHLPIERSYREDGLD